MQTLLLFTALALAAPFPDTCVQCDDGSGRLRVTSVRGTRLSAVEAQKACTTQFGERFSVRSCWYAADAPVCRAVATGGACARD